MATDTNDGDDIRDCPLVLNPHLRVVQCGNDELMVKHGFRSRFSTLLRDDGRTGLLAVVLRAFREPSTLADLERAGAVSSSCLTDAASLIEQLVSQKVLMRPTDYLPRVYLSMRFGDAGAAALEPASVGIVGCGPLGSRMAQELARVRVDRLVLLDDRAACREEAAYFDCATRLVEPGAPFVQVTAQALHEIGYTSANPVHATLHDDDALTRVFEECGFVLVALERYSPSVLHAANRAALAAGRPWMSVYFDGSEAVIGPIYVPGDTACYNEFEIQNEACIARQDDYHVYKDSLTSPAAPTDDRRVPDPVLPPFLAIASGWATTAALPFMSGGKSFLLERAVHIDFERVEIDYQDILRLPRCPACSPTRPAYRHTFL